MITILIDSREQQFASLLRSRDLDKYAVEIEFRIQSLDIGDIHLCYENKVWIFERKTVKDMIASIHDGRYKEQKQRLLASGLDCSYVIEGDDILSSRHEKYQSVLSSAYIHTIYRDGMKVIFTKHIADTCTFILTMCTKIIDKPQNFISDHPTQDYIDCIKLKTKKIDNITPDICFIMQLAQIPSISNVIAKNIQKVYPTMKVLIKTLDDAEDKVAVLCQIEKIGKEKASKILEYLQYA